jgi:hypothetical protein
MVDEITITDKDILKVNPGLLVEELGALVGATISMRSRTKGGLLVEATIWRADGADFTQDDRDKVAAVLAAHDPQRLSTQQQAERAAAERKDGALERLSALSADDVAKLTDPREVAVVLAEVIRALELDRV